MTRQRSVDLAVIDSHVQAVREDCRKRFSVDSTLGAGARSAPRPSLEEATLNQIPLSTWEMQNIWRVKRTTYGSGVVEVRGVIGGIARRKKPDSSEIESVPSPSKRGSTAERFDSSVMRSRRSLRAKCLSLNPDRMLTLTKRGKFANVDECWSAFKEFSRLMKVRFGERWQYVCVPELHSDGNTYHMHCAVKDFYLAETVRVLWFKALGGKGNEQGSLTPGNVDLKFFKRGHSRDGYSRVRRIAGYIAKYTGKGFDGGSRGRRLFSSSAGIDKPRVETRRIHLWTSIPEIVGDIQRDLIREGGSPLADCYLWSRHRADGSLLMTGFCISSELSTEKRKCQ